MRHHQFTDTRIPTVREQDLFAQNVRTEHVPCDIQGGTMKEGHFTLVIECRGVGEHVYHDICKLGVAPHASSNRARTVTALDGLASATLTPVLPEVIKEAHGLVQ